jgi:adenylate cyclase
MGGRPVGSAYETGEIPAPEATSALEAVPGDVDETVDALVALGVDESVARVAIAEGRVPLVLVQEVIGEPRDLTLEDLAEESGLEAEAIRRVFLALGMPLPDRFGDGDLEEARQLAELTEVMSIDTLVRLARVRGMAVSRIAMSDLNAMREQMLTPMREGGADDLTIAVALAEAAKALLPVSSDLLVHAYRRALFHAMSTEVVTAATREAGQEIDLVVGFVDLVGYTALSARIDPSGLDEVLDAFERRVLEVVGGAEDVTIVKFLGDAAMFVATDPVPLAAALVELVEPVEELEDSPMRAGMAAGPTLVREGDYYGAGVNMAARLTDRARPWSLLADDDLTEALEDRFETRRIRPLRIRGVGMRRPSVVRRPEGEA